VSDRHRAGTEHRAEHGTERPGPRGRALVDDPLVALDARPRATVAEQVPHRLRPVLRDVHNLVRHGSSAPRFAQRLWIDPRVVDERVADSRRLFSGRVVGGDWDRHRDPVETHPKVRACVDHWRHGVSWRDTGVYDLLLRLIAERGRPKDGCADLDDVIARYRVLDTIFAQVRDEGRLRTRAQLDPGAYRELGGVLINLDRDARPVAGGGGWHRLAMARVLGLARIPAQVGLVHVDALDRWRTHLDTEA
jgi:hypothetical protein